MSQALKDRKALKGLLVLKDLQDFKVLREDKDFKAFKDPQGFKDLKVHKELIPLVHQVLKVFSVPQEPQEFKEDRVLLEHKEPLGPQAHKER